MVQTKKTMTDKFKVGQRVRVIRSSLSGEIGTVERARYIHLWENSYSYSCTKNCYDVTVDGKPSQYRMAVWAFPENWLAPIYDGYVKTTWEDCYKVTGWKPEVVNL